MAYRLFNTKLYIYIFQAAVVSILLYGCTTWTITKRLEKKVLFTNPSAQAGYDTRSIFKRSLTGLNSEFSFSQTSCLTKAEEPSLSYYLPIAGGTIIGFIPFPRVLVQCEMQSVSSRIWTRIAAFISYGDNDYTTGTSKTPRAPPKEGRWQLHKNVASNIEQVLAATPHKTPTIRPPASHHENYPS